MYKYKFTFKQKNLLIEFATTNRNLIDSQFEKWIHSISVPQKQPVQKVEAPPQPVIKNEQIAKPVEKAIEAPPAKEKKTSALSDDFSGILSDKIQSSLNVALKEKNQDNDSSIIEFASSKKPKTLVDYIVCSAYYLYEHEKLDRFTFKQINQEVLKFAQKAADYFVLQQAVEKGYIKVVPDFTGVADITEYTITKQGEEYFTNEL